MAFAIRYTNTGQQDTTFGDEFRGSIDGVARFIPSSGMTGVAVNDMALDSSGRILLGGTAIISGQNVFAAWRFTSAGKRDIAFSSDGFTAFWPGQSAQALSIAADGSKAVLAGEIGGAGARRLGILRLTSSGSNDSTFDGDGWKEHNITQSSDESAWEVAIQSGSKPVLTGFSGDRVFMARFSAAGAQEFVTRTDVVTNSPVEGTTALAIDGSGRFVAAGWVGPPQ